MHALLRILRAVLLPLVGMAGAQTVGVDPIAKLHTARPGQTVTQLLNVYNPNPGDAVFIVNAYLTDFDHDNTGRPAYPKPGSVPESAGAWITVNPARVEIAPGASRQVRYTLQVPVDAKPGTHWAMLMFELQSPASTPGETLATFQMRVAHSIFVNVGEVRNSGEIVGIFEQASQIQKSKLGVNVQYQNTGNAATAVGGRLELRDEQGNVVSNVNLEAVVSLPQRMTNLAVELPGPLRKGRYMVLAVLDNGDRTKNIVAEQFIEVPFDIGMEATQAPSPEPPASPARGSGSAAGSASQEGR